MIKINKTTYKELQKFERHFRSVVYGSYIMNMSTKDKLELIEISRKIGYYEGVQIACNSCIIKFVGVIGKAYFEYQKTIEKKGEI